MLKVWPYWIARPKSIFIAVEGTLIGVLLLHAVWISQYQPATRAVAGSLGLVVALLACQVAFHLNKLDLLMLDSKPQIFLLKTLQSLAAGLVLTILLSLVFPRVFTGYGQALIAGSLAGSSLLVLRPLARLLVKHRKIVEGVLILGREDLASKLYRELVNGNGHFEFKGIIAGSLTPEGADQAGVIIDHRGLKELVLRGGISRIVLVEPDPKRREALATTLLGCKLCGVKIEEAVDFHERLNSRIWLEALHSEWLIYSDGFKPSWIYIRLKRIIDVAFALLLIALTTPLLILIALVIKLTSRGPVLFRQERVGLDGKVFVLSKFRSMRQNAELETGPTWAAKNDSRTTAVGRLLRKFRLDELPQAFNVLRGEMSFIGPRPERPYFVGMLRDEIPYYDLRHYVKPGITGWAQVMYPYGASMEDAYKKMQYDLYYVKHMSLWTDILILFKTLMVVLVGRGR